MNRAKLYRRPRDLRAWLSRPVQSETMRPIPIRKGVMKNPGRRKTGCLFAAVAALVFVSGPVWADEGVQVKEAWARETVPGQKVAGVFLEIVSARNARLSGVSTPAARVAELHSMTMDDGVMKMRQLPYIDLPAGQVVQLAPGGLHIMLFDLAKPLAAGDSVALTLRVKIDGKRKKIPVQVKVRDRQADSSSSEHQ
jgi:periplasmic copper chaperone A